VIARCLIYKKGFCVPSPNSMGESRFFED
jgi:hypothetical protein